MADENEGLLAYFQRMLTKLMAACATDTGFAQVSDDYLGTMMLDSIERIFMQGRKQEGPNVTSWDVLKNGVDKSPNLELLLATLTRSLDRQVGLSPHDKAMKFFQYAIVNKLMSNFCSALTKNTELISAFYVPGCVLSSPEHSSMFVLQLSTLESLNFSTLWSNQNTATQSIVNYESGPQKTTILQSTLSPAAAYTPTMTPPSSQTIVAPVVAQPIEAQGSTRHSNNTIHQSNHNPFSFGAMDASAPLTFSLKPKPAPVPTFTQAFVPMASTEATNHDSPALIKSSSSTSVEAAPLSEPIPSSSSSSAASQSFTQRVSSPPPSSLNKNSTLLQPQSNPLQPQSNPSSPPLSGHLAAEVEAPSIMDSTSSTPGSTKKRPKKRTIDL